jgi:hypothetical protein
MTELDSDLARFRDHAPPPPPDAAERVIATLLDDQRARHSRRREPLWERVVTLPARLSRPRRSQRSAALACTACLIAGGLLTPPGRAAIDRAGELAGIGEKPTLTSRGGPNPPTNTPLVVDNGHAPDRTRYEWVAYRANIDESDARSNGFCLGFEWPGAPTRETTGSCDGPGHQPGPSILDSFGADYLPRQDGRAHDRHLILTGRIGPQAHRLRVLYTDARGQRHELPVDFARVDGALLERVGGRQPFAVFVAFLTSDQISRDRLSDRLNPRLLAPPAPSQPAPDTRSASKPNGLPKRCHPRRGPFELVAYDAHGQIIETLRPIIIQIAPAGCLRRLPEPSSDATPQTPNQPTDTTRRP